MRIEIDQTLCQGHTMCARTAPALFEVDDSGFSQVRVDEVSPEQEAVARDAVTNCPEGAIAIVEG